MPHITPADFQRVFPLLREWMRQTLAASAASAKTVASFNFSRLPRYYSQELLLRSKVVLVDKVPVPPLSALGLHQFADFEKMSASGITYLDTYFVRRQEAKWESLHFHELVHVVQWSVLGAERFLALYADGLEKHGYRHSPLEVMAYAHQARFDTDLQPYDVEREVRQELTGFD